MRILADECVFRQVVECLREDGHNVQWVKESFPGLDDEDVLSKANEDQRVLLTEDKDFGELTVRFRFKAKGIVTVVCPIWQVGLTKLRPMFRMFSQNMVKVSKET